MMDEVRALLAEGYDEALPAMGGIGYRQFAAVIRGHMSADEALASMIRDTVRYAKRQMTWFAREPEIRWIDVDEAGGIEGARGSIILKVVTRGGTDRVRRREKAFLAALRLPTQRARRGGRVARRAGPPGRVGGRARSWAGSPRSARRRAPRSTSARARSTRSRRCRGASARTS